MAEYAVVETGGKQYRLAKGNILQIERLAAEVGKKIKLDHVLAWGDGHELAIGNPTVKGVAVTAEILEHLRGDKVFAFKKKRRKGYRRKVGHRQELTTIKVLEIGKATRSRKKSADGEATGAETPAAEGESHGA